MALLVQHSKLAFTCPFYGGLTFAQSLGRRRWLSGGCATSWEVLIRGSTHCCRGLRERVDSFLVLEQVDELTQVKLSGTFPSLAIAEFALLIAAVKCALLRTIPSGVVKNLFLCHSITSSLFEFETAVV